MNMPGDDEAYRCRFCWRLCKAFYALIYSMRNEEAHRSGTGPGYTTRISACCSAPVASEGRR